MSVKNVCYYCWEEVYTDRWQDIFRGIKLDLKALQLSDMSDFILPSVG